MGNTRRWRRKAASALILAAVAVTAAACSSSSSSSGGTTPTSSSTQAASGTIKKGLLVYFIPKDTQNPYEVIADAGGKFLAAGGKTLSQIGTPPAARVVIIQWPSLDAADAWWNAAAAKDAFAVGQKYATFRNFAVEGLPPK